MISALSFHGSFGRRRNRFASHAGEGDPRPCGGCSLRAIERQIGPTGKTVMAWRDAFADRGVKTLGVIAPGRGRRPVFGVEVIEAIVHDTFAHGAWRRVRVRDDSHAHCEPWCR